MNEIKVCFLSLSFEDDCCVTQITDSGLSQLSFIYLFILKNWNIVALECVFVSGTQQSESIPPPCNVAPSVTINLV